MRNIQELNRFATKYFPGSKVAENEHGELVIQTNLCLVDDVLLTLDHDESGLDAEPERPEFGKYKGA